MDEDSELLKLAHRAEMIEPTQEEVPEAVGALTEAARGLCHCGALKGHRGSHQGKRGPYGPRNGMCAAWREFDKAAQKDVEGSDGLHLHAARILVAGMFTRSVEEISRVLKIESSVVQQVAARCLQQGIWAEDGSVYLGTDGEDGESVENAIGFQLVVLVATGIVNVKLGEHVAFRMTKEQIAHATT